MVILDNGHGVDTAGKRSPVWADGTQLLEWRFNRQIVERIAQELQARGIPYWILVPEDIDISLSERCKRANAIYASNPDAWVLSVHANAGGGKGWEAYTSVGKTKSDEYAQVICETAQSNLPQWKMRFDYSDGDADKEAHFYILKNTNCPAVLTENGFMDNEQDCKYIMSYEGKEAIVKLHVDAIIEIHNKL